MAFINETYTSCLPFLFTLYIFLTSIFVELNKQILLCHFLTVISIIGVFRLLIKYKTYQIFFRALLLGVSFNGGLLLAFSDLSFRLLGWYIAVLSFFHWSEYVITSITNPRNLSLQSFLLDHSQEYHIAIVSSFIEYTLEWILLPGLLSEPSFISYMALGIVVGGEMFRKGAMWNAGNNFNHQVCSRRQEGHELVTSGLYAFCRHPSYVGWFYWCIGTQIMICNPVCAVLYALFSWFFFRERIITEEYTLYRFFGNQYGQYKSRVPSGIPLIYGFSPEQIIVHN